MVTIDGIKVRVTIDWIKVRVTIDWINVRITIEWITDRVTVYYRKLHFGLQSILDHCNARKCKMSNCQMK